MNDLILMRVLQCANSSSGIIGRSGMLKLLRGQHSRKFAKYGLDHLPEFGSLSHIDKSEILNHIDYMIERGCLQIGTLLFPMIQITDTGKARLSKMVQNVESTVVKVEQPETLIEPDKVHVCNEAEFWKLFPSDLEKARSSVVIMSPFVSDYRVGMIFTLLEGLIRRGIRVEAYIRPPDKEIDRKTVDRLQDVGVKVIFKKRIHQKIAIIDNLIAWSGSLNILQHINSNEQMTRHSDHEHVKKLLEVTWVEHN